MVDHSNMKLGKALPKHDPRTLALANYLTADAPTPPDATNNLAKVTNLGMMLNDQLGDCTCATVGHIIQVDTANNGNQIVLPDSAILSLYEASCGYDPTNVFSDQGGVELNVLNYWRQTGVAGHKLDAFASLEPQNQLHVKQSIWLFGSAYIGVALPKSAQNQDVWHVTPGGTQGDATPRSWGGHAIPIVDYNAIGPICITWGAPKQMTWGWYFVYCDEAYAPLAINDWTTNGTAPNGFNVASLAADLKAVTA